LYSSVSAVDTDKPNRHDLFDSESLLFHGKSPFLGYQILPETNLRSGSKIPGPINFAMSVRMASIFCVADSWLSGLPMSQMSQISLSH